MQPMIMLTSETEGLVYINGTFLGEVRPQAPLFRPIAAYGQAYMEFKPLKPGYISIARRIAFSNASPVPDSFLSAHGLNAIAWPFGITEIEFLPERIYTVCPVVRTIYGGGKTFRMMSGPTASHLEIDTAGTIHTFPLPANAKEPLFAKSDGMLYVSGETDEGDKYALILTENADKLLLSLRGKDISFLGNGRVSLTESAGNSAGHLRTGIWFRENGEYREESWSIQQDPSFHFQCLSPVELALHAVELLQLGLDSEAEECFSKDWQKRDEVFSLLRQTYTAARFHFSPPDGRNAVAALRSINEFLAEAIPVYYRCEMENGAWRLTDISLK